MNEDLDISVKHRQPFTSGLKTVTTKHLQMSSDETYWRNFNSRSSSSTQQLPKGIRIAFRLRDTGEFGVRTDEPCYKYPDDIQRGRERTMDLPPTLTDVRSECLWKKHQTQKLIQDLAVVKSSYFKEAHVKEEEEKKTDTVEKFFFFEKKAAETDPNFTPSLHHTRHKRWTISRFFYKCFDQSEDSISGRFSCRTIWKGFQ